LHSQVQQANRDPQDRESELLTTSPRRVAAIVVKAATRSPRSSMPAGIVDLTGDDRAMIYGALRWMADELQSDQGEHAQGFWTAKLTVSRRSRMTEACGITSQHARFDVCRGQGKRTRERAPRRGQTTPVTPGSLARLRCRPGSCEISSRGRRPSNRTCLH
jgi:hypothetical protein